MVRPTINAVPSLMFALVALLALVGCRHQAAVELLERDLRDQEDQIFRLQDKVDEYRALYESSRRQLDELKRSDSRAADDEPAAGRRRLMLPPRSESSERQPQPSIEMAPPAVSLPELDRPPPFVNPTIQPPDPNIPEGEAPRASSRPIDRRSAEMRSSDTSSSYPLPEPNLPAPPSGSTSPSSSGPVRLDPANPNRPISSDGKLPAAKIEVPSSADVEMITLNGQMTGPLNTDGQRGDEGITVLIEPRKSDGTVLERPAAVSIVAIDPAVPGDKARVGRWNFPAEEMTRQWRTTTTGSGLLLELRWTNQVPTHRKLNVHARYVTSDGRRLDAELPVEIEPPRVDLTAQAPRSPAMRSNADRFPERSMVPPNGLPPQGPPRGQPPSEFGRPPATNYQPSSRQWTRATRPLSFLDLFDPYASQGLAARESRLRRRSADADRWDDDLPRTGSGVGPIARREPRAVDPEGPLVILEDPTLARDRATAAARRSMGRDDDGRRSILERDDYLRDSPSSRSDSPAARTATSPRRDAPAWSPYR